MGVFPSSMRNRVIKGDVMETLRGLPDSCLDMIYGDPDYNVGVDYRGKKFTKKWDDYIKWYGALVSEAMRTMRPDGNLFLINYPRQNAYLRVRYLDKISHKVFDYVWVYPSNVGHSVRRFTTAHRSILHAIKSPANRFFKSQVAQPYQNPEDKRIKERLRNGHAGRMPYSWMYFNLVKNVSKDKTIHACQIPVPLFDLLLKASTKKDDKVFIMFGGSGTEVVRTKLAGRVYLSCEIHEEYYNMISSRLAEPPVDGATPSRLSRSDQADLV